MIPYFDAHCDTICTCLDQEPDWASFTRGEERGFRRNGGHIDLRRGAAFSRYAQFFALYYDPLKLPEGEGFAQCRRLHELFTREMARNDDLAVHCRTAADVEGAVAEHKVAALLSIEGGDLLNCDPALVETAAAWGVRLCNPVWNRANALSGTNCEEPERGLSPQGRDFIRQLERFGIYADVSHLSDPGFWDLIHMAQRPVIASHSNSRSLCSHRRNLTDDMFRAIRDTGGVVGINLYAGFVGGDSMDDLVRHVEHFLELDGEKTVCMGGDLDGCESLAAGFTGLQDVPQLYEALAKRGYPAALLEDIFWNNLLRLL
jgi:membrane dipeptidase